MPGSSSSRRPQFCCFEEENVISEPGFLLVVLSHFSLVWRFQPPAKATAQLALKRPFLSYFSPNLKTHFAGCLENTEEQKEESIWNCLLPPMADPCQPALSRGSLTTAHVETHSSAFLAPATASSAVVSAMAQTLQQGAWWLQVPHDKPGNSLPVAPCSAPTPTLAEVALHG